MYARICGLELMSSYITELGIGDILSLQALIKNPLDWSHFYEKISLIKKGGKTDFTVVTSEGDRLVGSGIVQDVEKWSNNGKFGFKIKVSITKQKSLADKRIRLENLSQRNQKPILQKSPAAPSSSPLAPTQQPKQVSPQTNSSNNNNNVVSELPQI
jgi:hypothetical protein